MGVTDDSEALAGDSDLIVTDLGDCPNHRSCCRNRWSPSNWKGVFGHSGNHRFHGYPRALCDERGDV